MNNGDLLYAFMVYRGVEVKLHSFWILTLNRREWKKNCRHDLRVCVWGQDRMTLRLPVGSARRCFTRTCSLDFVLSSPSLAAWNMPMFTEWEKSITWLGERVSYKKIKFRSVADHQAVLTKLRIRCMQCKVPQEEHITEICPMLKRGPR